MFFLDDLKNRSGVVPNTDDIDCVLQPILDRFPPLPGVNKSINRSWHYEFLTALENTGDSFDPTNTEYFKYYKMQEELLGLNRHDRCIAKCIRFTSLFRKIKKEG